MTGVIENMSFTEKIVCFLKKQPLKEFYYSNKLPSDFESRPQTTREINVKTTLKNAEKVAFKEARNLAKKLGYHNIFYKSYSGMNEDFMGDTSRKPKHYNIEAVLFN